MSGSDVTLSQPHRRRRRGHGQPGIHRCPRSLLLPAPRHTALPLAVEIRVSARGHFRHSSQRGRRTDGRTDGPIGRRGDRARRPTNKQASKVHWDRARAEEEKKSRIRIDNAVLAVSQ